MNSFRGSLISSSKTTSQLTIGGFHLTNSLSSDGNEGDPTGLGDNEDDSYDGSLESIPSISTSTYLESSEAAEKRVGSLEDVTHQQPIPVDVPSAKSIVKGADDHATIVKLIREFETKDPLSKLLEYYQKKGFTKTIGDHFSEFCHHDRTGKYWRCTFRCPLSGEETSSQLPPIALMCGGNDRPTTDNNLVELVEKFLGRYKTIDDLVYFGSKKGAKKSVAVAVLLKHRQEHGSHSDQVLVKAENEQTSNRPADPVIIPSPNKPMKSRKHPGWVHKLYHAGVEKVDISYREKLQWQEWQGQLTQCRCTMSISEPQNLSVVGMPHPSKQEARESAMDMLLQQLQQLGLQKTGQEARTPNDDIEETNKKKNGLARADAKTGYYVYPLPPWACAPMSTDPDKSSMYLYELVFATKLGEPLARKFFSLRDDEATRIGIIFPQDIEPDQGVMDGLSGGNSTRYSTPLGFNGAPDDEFTVALRYRTVIDLQKLGKSDEIEQNGLAWIQSFNRSVKRWKSYGRMNEPSAPCATDEIFRDNGRLHFARTYLFVPLLAETNKQGMMIDWETLRHVHAGTTIPYVAPPLYFLRLPFYEIEARQAYALLSLVLVLCFVPKPTPTFQDLQSEPKAALDWLIFSLFVTGALFAMLHHAPRKLFSDKALKNRFLFQSPCPTLLYSKSGHENEDLRANSLYKSSSARAVMTKEDIGGFKRKYDLDLSTATFREFYLKKYGAIIKYQNEKLVTAYNIEKHLDFNPLERQETSAALIHVYLIPELIRVLPIPRDALYVLGLAERFMPLLERTISLSHFSRIFYQMASNAPKGLDNSKTDISGMLDREHRNLRSLSNWIAEATTLFPSQTYQRLEFFGDAVLGFFIAINLFSRNSSLYWNCEDNGKKHSEAGSNAALFCGALRVGLSRLICAGVTPCKKKASGIATSAEDLELSQYGYCADQAHIFQIADSTLGDMVESVLAALYMYDMGNEADPTGGSTVVAFLDCLDLPMPQSDEDSAPGRWFVAKGPCLKLGYPFAADVSWQKQLVAIGNSLSFEPDILQRLEEGYISLLQKFSDISVVDRILHSLREEPAKILLLTALFDDNLEGPMERLLPVGLLRDTLFHVGAYALQLLVSEELFSINPVATAGDLHLLRACAISDDVVVYIMMHAKIHQCLFDKSQTCLSRVKQFDRFIREADKIGAEEWNRKGGWIVGGLHDFRHRCAKHFPGRGHLNDSRHPQYHGIAGGRLYGRKSKIPVEFTGDLMFSFKSIVGALVLALGSEGMWCCIRPLFEEVLILKAEELRREYRNVSTLCRASNSGKKQDGGDSEVLLAGVIDRTF